MLVTFEGQRINQPVYYLSFTTVKKIFLFLKSIFDSMLPFKAVFESNQIAFH